MLQEFLLPETTLREPGFGPDVDLGEGGNRCLSIILTITRTSEQQVLDMSIRGSPDGMRWSSRPLVKLPHQFYCGTWRTELHLPGGSDIRHLRADWQMARWGRSECKPVFTVEVKVQENAAA